MGKKTPSLPFSVGDCFEIVDGPWKGEKGVIKFIGIMVFGYDSGDGIEKGLPMWYLESDMIKKIERCDG